MGVPFQPYFDRYATLTMGLESIDDSMVVNEFGINGVALVTQFVWAGNWQYCDLDPVTVWVECSADPVTTWTFVA